MVSTTGVFRKGGAICLIFSMAIWTALMSIGELSNFRWPVTPITIRAGIAWENGSVRLILDKRYAPKSKGYLFQANHILNHFTLLKQVPRLRYYAI
jgi:hypothetical protein